MLNYVEDDDMSDPLFIIPRFDPNKPGGYAKDEWVTYNGGWYLSLEDGNEYPALDRMAWKGPYTMKDIMALLSASINGES